MKNDPLAPLWADRSFLLSFVSNISSNTPVSTGKTSTTFFDTQQPESLWHIRILQHFIIGMGTPQHSLEPIGKDEVASSNLASSSMKALKSQWFQGFFVFSCSLWFYVMGFIWGLFLGALVKSIHSIVLHNDFWSPGRLNVQGLFIFRFRPGTWMSK